MRADLSERTMVAVELLHWVGILTIDELSAPGEVDLTSALCFSVTLRTLFFKGPTMKLRIGVYLSEQMAARLVAAADRFGASKSAVVEAALAQFIGADDDAEKIAIDRCPAFTCRQIEELDRTVRVIGETVALLARYQLAVTPPLPPAALRSACALGSDRFDELAIQVRRRVQLKSSLMQETIDRLEKEDTATDGGDRGAAQTSLPGPEPGPSTSHLARTKVEHSAAAGEGGSPLSFPARTAMPLQ